MTILLIEDDRRFSELIEAYLKDVDLHVAESLAAAQQRLASLRVDLILVDLGLPDSHGLDTLRALQSVRAPKVVLTGADVDVAEVAKLGGIDYIPKTDAVTMKERIQFHVSRLAKKPRFPDAVFKQICACIEMPTHGELMHVS